MSRFPFGRRRARTKAPPAHLGHMYILLLALLAAAGANAGMVATTSYDIVNTDFAVVCVANIGLDDSFTGMTLASQQDLLDCSRSAGLPWALVMLAGAATSLVAPVLLVVAGGCRVRWRLHRQGQAHGRAADAARDRFARRCDDHGLQGRHPDLWILPPGSRFTEAFTTGVPLRRPMVVVPAAVACGPPQLFDPIVQHELAHVEARDVTLAAAAWWSAWSSVVLLAIAAAPFVDPTAGVAWAYVVGLAVAAVTTLMLVAFRAHVLRLRELAADRVAADRSLRSGDLADLMTNRSPGTVPAARWRLRAMFSSHPAAADRAGALGTGTTGVDGGFLSSAATALILMTVVMPFAQLYQNWVGWGTSISDSLYAVVGLLIGALVTPVWIRRAAGVRHGLIPIGWLRPVLGLGLGMLAGYLLPSPGMPASPALMALTAHWSVLPLFLFAACGIAALIAALAGDADANRRRHVVATTTAGAAVGAVALPAVMTVMTATAVGSPAFFQQAALRSGTTPDWDILVVFAVIAVTAAANGRSTALWSRPWKLLRRLPAPRLIATVTVIATASGTLISLLRTPAGDADTAMYMHLMWQRWWVSALAGTVLLIALLTRSSATRTPGHRITVALAAAGAVTLTSSLAQFFGRFLVQAASGGGPRYGTFLFNLGEYTWTPLRILLLLSMLTVPVSMLIRGRWPGPWAVERRARRSLAAAAATVVVCAATMSGLGGIVTGEVGDARLMIAAVSELTTPPPAPALPPATPTAGRPLTRPQLNEVFAAAGRALPGWTRAEPPDDSAEDVTSSGCGPEVMETAVAPGQAVEAGAAFDLDQKELPPIGASLYLEVTSYHRPPEPSEHLRELSAGIERCPSFTQPDDNTTDHLSHFHLSIDKTRTLPYPALNVSLVNTRKFKISVAVITLHAVETVIGHNVVSVFYTYVYFGDPPAHQLADLDNTVDVVLTAAVRQMAQN